MKSMENRLRRVATRQGLRLMKSRRRDPRALTFATYQLVDAGSNYIVAGDHNGGFGLTLADVEQQLAHV